ncbi:hypothetical protein HK097_006877, partial [Rhizophlyctis rosea]
KERVVGDQLMTYNLKKKQFAAGKGLQKLAPFHNPKPKKHIPWDAINLVDLNFNADRDAIASLRQEQMKDKISDILKLLPKALQRTESVGTNVELPYQKLSVATQDIGTSHKEIINPLATSPVNQAIPMTIPVTPKKGKTPTR